MVTGGSLAAVTVMVNAGSDALEVPSVALITMFENAPTFELDGAPLSSPLAVLNCAHAGPLLILNDTAAPLPPDAVGVNEYICPTGSLFAGLPLIVSLLAGLTVVPGPSQAVSVRLIIRVPTIVHVPRTIRGSLIQSLQLRPHTSQHSALGTSAAGLTSLKKRPGRTATGVQRGVSGDRMRRQPRCRRPRRPLDRRLCVPGFRRVCLPCARKIE